MVKPSQIIQGLTCTEDHISGVCVCVCLQQNLRVGDNSFCSVPWSSHSHVAMDMTSAAKFCRVGETIHLVTPQKEVYLEALCLWKVYEEFP